MKLLQLGHIALDGTKIDANATKHKALSWGQAKKIEAQLRQEVQTLLALAEICITEPLSVYAVDTLQGG